MRRSWALLLLAISVGTYLFSSTSAILPDGAGYFSYLPSLFFDGDLQLADEFRRLGMNIPLAVTVNGYAATQWPIGPATLWSPFYAFARLTSALGATPGGHGCDGWYWRFVNQATPVYVALALALFFGIARARGFRRRDAAWAAACATIGTPLLFYTWIVPSTSHGVSAFATTLVVAATLATEGSRSPARWGLLGVLCGVATMVRPQNGLFLMVPLADWIRQSSRLSGRRKGDDAIREVLPLVAGFVVGASPQLLLNWIFHGSPMAQPSAFNVGLQYFALHKVLLSPYHGALFWTPVLFMAIAGLAASARRGDWISSALLAIAGGDLLVDGLCVAWWEGHSFGLRQTCGLWTPVAVGLAHWFRRTDSARGTFRWMGRPLAAACALWTLGLFFHSVGGLELEWYVSAGEILRREATWPLGASNFASWTIHRNHPRIALLLLLVAPTALLMAASAAVWREVEAKRLGLVLLCSSALIGGLDLVLLAAHARRTPIEVKQGEVVIPASQLPGFFIDQALKNPSR